MIPGFEAIVEERIKQAQKEGRFNDLKGQGRPLQFDETNVPEEFRMAHKILKNAGFLPPEIEIKKQIEKTRDLMAGMDEPTDEKKALTKKLNYLLVKLDSVRGDASPALTLARDRYRTRLIKKIS
ncbi:MAG: molecular chaperone DnaJ [Desulfobacterales bacterium]|nr:MAG: molecular chaperone DnaJ [Desulfobacterales bacterium]